MINRDFTRSGKEYVNKNKIVLIILAMIVAIGVVMMCVFGFKGGTDVAGYQTFSINIGSEYESDKMGDYTQEINAKLSSYDAELQSVQLTGEGDSTTLVVKYLGKVKDVAKLNTKLAENLKLDVSTISAHTKVSANLTNNDYIYAIAGGLIILVLAVIYVACRYNLACAITALAGSIFGVILLMCLTAIFRLTVNSSFLAINIITLLLILGESFMMFDRLEKERFALKDKNDRATQLLNTLKANSFRQKLMYGSIFAILLVFVILMPSTIKQASLIGLFAIVAVMIVTVYALPFLWNLTITQVSDKIRVKKVKKVKQIQETSDVEGELENQYTENQVIEVKEDNGDTNPSQDENIVIE